MGCRLASGGQANQMIVEVGSGLSSYYLEPDLKVIYPGMQFSTDPDRPGLPNVYYLGFSVLNHLLKRGS